MDPTSAIGEEDPDEAPACDACGDSVVGPDRRVRTWIDDDGVQHRHFCCVSCLADWTADQRDAAEA
jgi:hypothetical protein